jgi:formylglycine-generating enzyme required for sulfatase activity
MNCHPGDKRPSIDYSRDDSCFECHGPGLSDKYKHIDSKYDKSVIGYNGRGKGAGEGSFEDMAYIPAGEFTMGSNEWWPKSQPEHKKVTGAFYMDKYEVTNKRYKKFVEAVNRTLPAHWVNGMPPAERAEHPVVFVSWYDANDFCRWEGKRLLTEPEWEKAARGADKRAFPWGDKFEAKRGNMPQLGKNDTMPVGSFENGKSPYGVYDMAGNVWEWTSDWFKPYPGNNHPDENYGEKYKVVRGGSWYDCTYYKCGLSAPTYNRIFFNPMTMNNNFGFRCARDAK